MILITQTIASFTVALISLKYGYLERTKSDHKSLIGAGIALIFWIIFHQPYVSVMLLLLIDVI